MRRTTLEAPEAVLPPRASPARHGEPEVPRRGLEPPSSARERRRPLFHPRRGWLRRFERSLNNALSTRVYPRIPLLHRIYDAQLERSLTLSQAEVGVVGLPSGFEGLRLLFVSDLHVGPFVSVSAMRRVLERLQSVEPDLILLGGDLVSTALSEFVDHRSSFALLRAPCGVFAVLGNHDHYTRAPARLREMVEACGIRVLHNRSVELQRGGDRLSLAGVDDLLIGTPDLDAALAGTRSPVVLLSHNPDLAFAAQRRGVSLMLSGHTHGGQIRIPGAGVLVRQSRYRLDEGRYRAGSMEIVVSRGLGVVGVPWRIGCPPEAVLLRLTAAAPS